MTERRKRHSDCKRKRGIERKKAVEGSDSVADAAGVQLVRLHRDTHTEAIRSLVGISAPVCHVFLGQVGA